jgi:hypothetical protein
MGNCTPSTEIIVRAQAASSNGGTWPRCAVTLRCWDRDAERKQLDLLLRDDGPACVMRWVLAVHRATNELACAARAGLFYSFVPNRGGVSLRCSQQAELNFYEGRILFFLWGVGIPQIYG